MKKPLSGKFLLAGLYLLILLLAGAVSSTHLVSVVEIKTLGLRMRIRDVVTPPAKCPAIVLVKIDRSSAAPGKYGRFPWKRDRYVKLLSSLPRGEEGPRAIAFDIIFSYDDPAQDGAFADKVGKQGNIVFAIGWEPPQESAENSAFPSDNIVFRPLAKKLKELSPRAGSIIIPESTDQKIVTIPSMVKGAFADDATLPLTIFAFEVEIARMAKNNESLIPRNDHLQMGEERIPFDRKYEIFEKTRHKKSFPGPFIVSYRGTPSRVFDSYSFHDVAEGKIPSSVFRDRVVLVINTIDPNDMFFTTRGDRIFGGELHAYALRTILEKDYVKTVNAWFKLFIYLALTLPALSILLAMKNRLYATLLLLMLACAYLSLATLAFTMYSLWLPVVFPLLGVLLVTLGYIVIERYAFKKTLGALLPGSFLDRLDVIHNEPRLGGTSVHATVLFADIRGYTNLSETLSSVEVMNMLNDYHQRVKKPIGENGGETFDFQGDAYMVVFGANQRDRDHARRAVATALAIVKVAQEIRKCRDEEGGHSFDVGVGICTGEVALGYLGEGMKLTPAAIGDTTNVAARLQGKSSEFNTPILMTESTAIELGETYPLRRLPEVELKGKKEKLSIYTIDWEKL